VTRLDYLKELKGLTGPLEDLAKRMEKFGANYKLLDSMQEDSLEKANLVRALNLCDRWREDLEDMERSIKTLVKPLKIGTLTKNDRGRYELGDHEFTCGSSIAVFVGEEKGYIPEWEFGRVEHSCGDYYFNASEKFALAPGMKAAVRG
jgi:hypothetical protein